MTTVKLLCWGHRRAVDPIAAFAKLLAERHPEVTLAVDVRPLSDFEHQGMEGVAKNYDLVVFDHPFCGDIVSGNLFVPLDEVFPDLLGPSADALYIGGTLRSYRLAGHVWGAPIDAATQHALFRADLMEKAGASVPQSWDEALALGPKLVAQGLHLGLAVETPHALCTIGSLMANAGRAWSTDPAQPLTIDAEAFAVAFDKIRALLAFCPPEAMDWNSIDLHDQMVARDDIAYCPAVYGYATYGEADMRRRLSFAEFAGSQAPYWSGSAIGGTAIGLSRFSQAQEAACKVIALALTGEVQDDVFARHHGQPALVSGWRDGEINTLFNGFYADATRSMETVWVRPRHPGYILFQNQAGAVVAEGLRTGAAAAKVYEDVAAIASRVETLKV